MRKYKGIVTRIAYYATERQYDHVDIRLDADVFGVRWDNSKYIQFSKGDLVSCYRCEVEETGPQECQEEDWRRKGP